MDEQRKVLLAGALHLLGVALIFVAVYFYAFTLHPGRTGIGIFVLGVLARSSRK